jgi:hypothetical protein
MSYDISLGTYVRDRWYDIIDVGNMTSNVAGMWRLASPDTDGLKGLHGKTAGEAIGPLSKAVLRMRADPDAYMPLVPANGWGSYDGAMEFMSEILKACREHPWLTISVDV